jgi:hypothetical protein
MVMRIGEFERLECHEKIGHALEEMSPWPQSGQENWTSESSRGQ